MAPPKRTPTLEKRVTDVEIMQARKRNKDKAKDDCDWLYKAVDTKSGFLFEAALRIGKAFSQAIRKHRAVVAQQAEHDAKIAAVENGLTLLALNILTVGAASWLTESIKLKQLAALGANADLDVYEALHRSALADGLETETRMWKRLADDIRNQVSLRGCFKTLTG